MTREEALRRVKGYLTDIIPIENYSEVEEIVQALEQQPCDDAINRKAVYEQINSWNSNGEYSYTNATFYLMKRIRDIPTAIPQQKIGKWLNGELIPNDITGHWYAECSECGKMRIVDNYCPNCGARMEDTKDEISE